MNATTYESSPTTRCPTGDSPAPHLHPAMQYEGEVEMCRDPYHLIRTAQNAQWVDAK